MARPNKSARKRKSPGGARGKVRTSRKSRRKLGRASLADISYPSQRDLPTAKSKRGTTPTSGLKYKTSVIFVGLTADLLTPQLVSSLVKRCADRSRPHLQRGGKVSVRLMTMFAKMRSVVEMNDGEDLVIIDLGEYDDDFFPSVGDEWEWRSRYSGYVVSTLDAVRQSVRSQLEEAKSEDQDGNFVLVDAIEITKWG